ncbi:hypothetical protein EJ110_NYTH39541 [Nymphaea thermarum]|nr:hypothetical protein EJ110_NYTH39541 [Nymphaea thermarum]
MASHSSAATSSMGSYPYPLNLNVSNFVSLKLTHNNFLLWKTQVLALIESQDMEGFLIGAISAPPKNITVPADPQKLISNPRYESWRRSDHLIKGWITGMLSKSVLGLVVGLNSSQEIWSTLINAFAQESQEWGFHLIHMLTTCKKGDDTLDVYVGKFKAICDDLAAIGKDVGDQEKAFWLLHGLGKGYEPFVKAMLKPLVPSYKELISLLQSLEVRNKFLNSNVPPQVAFYAQHEGQTRSRGTYHNSRGQGRNNRGRGGGYNPNLSHGGGYNSNPPHTPKLNDSANSSKGVLCQICNKKNHTAMKCYNRFLVIVGNGQHVPITHVGQADVSPNLSLKDVLYVPHLTKDLISVSKLTNDFPYDFEFTSGRCILKDRRTGRIMATGTEQGGLYAVDNGSDNQAIFSSRF